MSLVEFEGENSSGGSYSNQIRDELNKSKIVLWVVKKGIIKDERHVEYVLIGLAIICLFLSVLTLYNTFTEPSHPEGYIKIQVKEVRPAVDISE